MDITTASLLKLLHVLAAFWFIIGLLGRNVTIGHRSRVSDPYSIATLSKLAGRFDNLMVIPASLLVFVLGLIVALEANWPLLGSLEGSDSNWLLASLIVYLSVLPLVPAVFLPRGKVFESALQDSLSEAHITSALKNALNDNVVKVAHAYELFAVFVVIVLMITKPF